MSMHHTGLAADARVVNHDPGPGHPEQPARYQAVLSRLEWSGLSQDLIRIDVRPATTDDLLLVHTRAYLDLVDRQVAEEGTTQLSTGDTQICPYSAEAARVAAGAALSAVDAVFSGSVANAFCVVRPPGHHASTDRGMGFCIYNNVALAARHAQRRYGAERVLIADWDVHHGNGTQDIFYRDGSVLFFSTHQSPWYPGTGAASEAGEGKGAGKIINCPLRAGAGRREISGAFEQRLLPAADSFRPDVILLSAGFDSRINDPLGQFVLNDSDFNYLTALMTELAARHCQGRLISVLEGGYNLEGLALAAEAHVRALMGDSHHPHKTN
ncbi:MAG: histone deacetylase [Acidobacteriaceae bacterium]|nr:histone deacetylase [Acidobacteriaceae bacterium]